MSKLRSWTYEEDFTIIDNINLTGRELHEILIDRDIQTLNRRKKYLKGMTKEKLAYEKKFILRNWERMTSREIADALNLTAHAVGNRILNLKLTGEIKEDDEVEEKPKTTTVYKPKPVIIEPMKVEMEVPFKDAPVGSLSKAKIQEDFLEVGKTYKISTRMVKGKPVNNYKKKKLKLIGCYPSHYLFEDEKGLKHTLNKVNYYLGEWEYECS